MFSFGKKQETVHPSLKSVFGYIDEHQEQFIKNLEKAVAIRSVSTWRETRPEVERMIHWVGGQLEKLGAVVEYHDIGEQTMPDGKPLKLPPVLFGELGNNPEKKTLLVYGHMDVQPASKQDGWNTEPFSLTRSGSKLFGRGASDDKGPVLGWLHAVESFQKSGEALPINLRFCIEGMEESGSVGLDKFLRSRQNTDFLKKVDAVCISDNYWLGKNKPCITYGLRGCCYFFIEIESSAKDLHSGVFGGTVHEAMSDLIYLFGTLKDANEKITIDGLMDTVEPCTAEELQLYKDIEFDLGEYQKDLGAFGMAHDDKIKTLMARWRFPSLSIHGIEGAFSGSGSKTVIPSKVTGKFSIRIVPNQTPEEVEKVVLQHINQKWAERGSPNKMKASLYSGGRCWMSDIKHPNYVAGCNAVKTVYGVEPDMTREGGSIPITLTLEELTGKSVILLPMGASDDGAHSQNEKIDLRNYIEGTKVLAAYMHELANMS
jgi:nonspecific dipeptidase